MVETESAPLEQNVSIDGELAAIQAVLAALTGLQLEARQRVIDYVFQRLGLAPVSTSIGAPMLAAQLPDTGPVPTRPDSGTAVRDIRSLKEQKQPRTAVEMAALVGYYLAELAPEGSRKSEFGTEDITTYFKQAGFPLPATPRQTLFNAKAAGYLDAAAHGAYKLNPVGHNLVAHGMPSNGSDVTAKNRGKRVAKKPAKKGKSRKAK